MSEIEYLAIPYSHKDCFVLECRALISDTIAVALAKTGRVIYAPISSWHRVAVNHRMKLDWETWKKFDEEFIKVSKKLLIVTLPGWKESSGVKAEMELAKDFNIPVEYIDPTQYVATEQFILFATKLSTDQSIHTTTTFASIAVVLKKLLNILSFFVKSEKR